ncbi:LOW QUALITY PROTEIN: protein LATERAL ROOT PRIMORDIUM 1 [Salvia miltiorrhiza]|uniref:LOW QUALITY PROTEIN: protein LATERAL ROOT PRIMORDIUM 1 n=1 Tax=Salvia miltiorrhiza TaxID=226208 RepID=UPI0025AB7B40|nr:LOW QUALITY PROTEIN: protein LATERAL ROOT PRIMORDIUM 1 [Salvia miltiorrhiza]
MPAPPPPTPPPPLEDCGPPPPPPPPAINCGLPPEFYFVAPASSFHHAEAAATAATTINFDPHSLNASNAIGVGVIPLLTASPCIAAADEDVINSTSRSRGAGMQLWQQLPDPYLKKPLNSNIDHANLGGGGASSSVGTTTCQDCGNQAKKDCPHRRCRTCCKSRGYDCSTHVKSTWVPAARRRERQLMGGNTATAGSSQSTSGTKKPRLGGASQTTTASHTSTSNTTPPRSFDTTSSHLDASLKESLPGQVRAPAVFKCVRVTAVDDGEDEFAYQAVVKIGGHIFKGFLYDQGFEGRESFPDISELHLGGLGGGGGRNGAALDPTSDMYAASSGGGLLGGSTYGNQIN